MGDATVFVSAGRKRFFRGACSYYLYIPVGRARACARATLVEGSFLAGCAGRTASRPPVAVLPSVGLAPSARCGCPRKGAAGGVATRIVSGLCRSLGWSLLGSAARPVDVCTVGGVIAGHTRRS